MMYCIVFLILRLLGIREDVGCYQDWLTVRCYVGLLAPSILSECARGRMIYERHLDPR
jgi:hypothetical protein